MVLGQALSSSSLVGSRLEIVLVLTVLVTVSGSDIKLPFCITGNVILGGRNWTWLKDGMVESYVLFGQGRADPKGDGNEKRYLSREMGGQVNANGEVDEIPEN